MRATGGSKWWAAAAGRQIPRTALFSLGLVLALVGGACAKAVSSPDDHRAGAGLTGGSGSESSGAPSAGGSPSSGGALGGASAGAAGALGTDVSGGSGPVDILAALDIHDATIDNRAGRELLELALEIGYAEGYAQCTCLPPSPLEPSHLDLCARAESGLTPLFDAARFRCVLEQSLTVPGFDELVRCHAKNLRSRGRAYQQCPDGPGGPNRATEPSYQCSDDASAQVLSGNMCHEAIVCGDGKFQQTGRCDGQLDCSDGNDERGCREIACGDQLIDAVEVCAPEACPVALMPPFCVPDDPWHMRCGDGTQSTIMSLCNDVQECATGVDEQYCYR